MILCICFRVMKLRSLGSGIIFFLTLFFLSRFVFAQPLNADENSANSDTTHSGHLSSHAPRTNLPLATAILKRLRAASNPHQSIQAKMSGEYRLNPSLASPFVADFQLEAHEPNCILVAGNDWLSEKIKLPYVSQDKRTFLDREQETAWVPGEFSPSDLYKFIFIGAPIPDVFQRVVVSWSEKNSNWFKLTITYTEKWVHKEEVLHVDPSQWRVTEATLRDTDTDRIIWDLQHEGTLEVRNENNAAERFFPEKTFMRFTFVSAKGQIRKRAIQFIWQEVEFLSNREKQSSKSCPFSIANRESVSARHNPG